MRLGQLLEYWPPTLWAEALSQRESNTLKKINGTYGFILRDALELSKYFSVAFETMIELVDAEMEHRKLNKKR